VQGPGSLQGVTLGLTWQGCLFAAAEPAVDAAFSTLVRHQLDDTAWVDHTPRWLAGADDVFEELLAKASWRAHTRVMYGNKVDQPRLNASWRRSNGTAILPVLDEARRVLSARYGVEFDSGGLNLYRDGRDSVAWHGDRIPASVVDPIVAILSLGEPRRFRLRPKGGGPSLAFSLGQGDLLVTGGTCQRTWQHSVPKVAAAGARMSVTFRHGMRD
jgi:alkylated DNA repair dioxygenase AlkB